jgi:hypothetical protein
MVCAKIGAEKHIGNAAAANQSLLDLRTLFSQLDIRRSIRSLSGVFAPVDETPAFAAGLSPDTSCWPGTPPALRAEIHKIRGPSSHI